MKYLCFVRSAESHRNSTPPAALMEAMGKFTETSRASGVLVDTGGLLPSKDGARIRIAGGELTVTDGPFSEAKEVIGGWAILQGDRATVMRASIDFMELHRKHWPGFDCECEIRAMFEPPSH